MTKRSKRRRQNWVYFPLAFHPNEGSEARLPSSWGISEGTKEDINGLHAVILLHGLGPFLFICFDSLCPLPVSIGSRSDKVSIGLSFRWIKKPRKPDMNLYFMVEVLYHSARLCTHFSSNRDSRIAPIVPANSIVSIVHTEART